MKKIIHLSDLHFGTERPNLVNTVLEDIKQLQPDLIIISGDLTQRARTNQFNNASQFVRALPAEVLCVPGNHDIALYNLIERFFYPFKKYQKWIQPLCPYYVKDNIAICGINSVTPYKAMSGYVTENQLQNVINFFKQQTTATIKMIVMHHNLIHSERHKIINDSEKIINIFAACNINLVLSGHIHAAHIELLKPNNRSQPMYVITAGTAISNRTIEKNSFNVIELSNTQFKYTVRSFQNNQFQNVMEDIYSF